MAAKQARNDRLAADLGAGRHHQFPDLRPGSAASRVRCGPARRRSHGAFGPAGRNPARPQRTGIRARSGNNGHCRRGRRAEPRRRDRRRGHRMHRSDERGADRGRSLRSDPDRGDRAQAQYCERCPLPLRARPRSGLCRGRAGDRDPVGAGAVRRRGVRGRHGRRRPRLAAPICAARRAAGEPWRAPRTASRERRDPDGARLRGRDCSQSAISPSSRRHGEATSSARPTSSRRCCASRATTRSRQSPSNGQRHCRGRH